LFPEYPSYGFMPPLDQTCPFRKHSRFPYHGVR
jgi:hypothetical protein